MLTQEEALKWLAGIFAQPVDRLTPETLREDIPDWDSLGVLTLMAGLDEDHGILTSDEELRAMTKIGDILDVLRKAGRLS